MSILKRRAELIVPVVTRTPAANSWLWDRCSVVPAIFGPQARLPTRAPRERPGPTTPNSSEYGRNEYGGLPVCLSRCVGGIPLSSRGRDTNRLSAMGFCDYRRSGHPPSPHTPKAYPPDLSTH